jgi:hypothetical protein
MDKFNFFGHDMVVMTEDELKEMLIDANAKGYMTGHSTGHIKGYDLGKKV